MAQLFLLQGWQESRGSLAQLLLLLQGFNLSALLRPAPLARTAASRSPLWLYQYPGMFAPAAAADTSSASLRSAPSPQGEGIWSAGRTQGKGFPGAQKCADTEKYRYKRTVLAVRLPFGRKCEAEPYHRRQQILCTQALLGLCKQQKAVP